MAAILCRSKRLIVRYVKFTNLFKHGMSFNKGTKRGRHRNDKHKPSVGERGREILKDMDESNPVIIAFRSYATELDSKHDRYERIVKISRDITIESKRIIFLLHNVDKENKRESILEEAETRLNNLLSVNFKNIAKELEGQDCYLYLRAYTAGLQEFVEAYTFFNYIKEGNISHWNSLEQQMTYSEQEIPEQEGSSDMEVERMLKTPLPPVEFVLGVADLTGELMRKCINNLGSGNIDDCFQICNYVKELYKGFLMVGGVIGCKELGRKVYTLKQSLYKMEAVCYNIVVRGSEVPKHMLADVAVGASDQPHDDQDEGFY